MKREHLIEILKNMENEDISFNHLKRLFVENNKNYENFHVYVFYKNSEILYVGQTTNLRSRFVNHFRSVEHKNWKDTITHVEIYNLDNYREMMELESFLINSLKPTYNEKKHIEPMLKTNNYDFYKISNVDMLNIIERKEVSYSSILAKLEIDLISEIDKIVLVDWLRINFYNNDTMQNTVDTCYKNLKQKILKLCQKHSYTLISKRGKGNKAYIIKNNN